MISTENSTFISEVRNFVKAEFGKDENPLELLHSIEPTFKDSVFNGLPNVLKLGLSCFKSKNEKGVFLVSSLAIISGILPNYYHLYDNKVYESNLFLYIIAGSGSGKGVATHAKDCLDLISRKIDLENDELINAFKIEYARHQSNLLEAKQNKDFERIAELEANPPEDPKTKRLFVSFNNSESNLVKTIKKNQGRAIFFSTEGDVVTNSMQKEYNNNLRSFFNQSYHHDEASFERLQVESNIKNPKVSLLITSTIDQFLRLMKDPNDGFFSRFLLFSIPSDTKFKNPYEGDFNKFEQKFNTIKNTYLELYEYLNSCSENHIEFKFREHQKKLFLDIMQIQKIEAMDVDEQLGGIVNRRGVIFFRIAMILSIIDAFESKSLRKGCVVLCSDEIFNLTLEISHLFYHYTLKFYDILPKNNLKFKSFIESDERKIQEKLEAIKLHESGLSIGQICEQLYGKNTKNKTTVHRWINAYKASK